MAEKEVKVSFGALKMQALEYYMQQEGNQIEDALKEHLDKLYQKNVPKQVQDFIEKGPLEAENVQEQDCSQPEPEGEQQESGAASEQEHQEPVRTSGRGSQGRTTGRNQPSAARNNRLAQRQSAQESEPPTEENVQGQEEDTQEQSDEMVMSM